MGSFVFLSTYTSDAPFADGWRESRRMALCDTCHKCVDNCPTGAIHQDKRLIDTSRCLTMHNEAGSSVPFPAWIVPEAHNAIIGCLRCQMCCSMNKGNLGLETGPVEFDEAETALLLEGKPIDELPASLTAKMQQVAMDEYYEPVARNLKALLMSCS
jgi:epoxyqueuosine reductase